MTKRRRRKWERITASISPATVVMLDKIASDSRGNRSFAIEEAIRRDFRRWERQRVRAEKQDKQDALLGVP